MGVKVQLRHIWPILPLGSTIALQSNQFILMTAIDSDDFFPPSVG